MAKEKKRKKKRLWGLRTFRFFNRTVALILRTVLFAIMLFCLICASVWVLFVRTFNAQQISERITQGLQKHLGRPVSISSIELTFINTLELKGLYVLDTEGDPGKPIISAESVNLRFQLLPLFERKLIIDEVSLKSPRFSIIRSAEGKYNIPHVQTKDKEVQVATPSSDQKFLININDWTIQEGILSLKDESSNTTHSIYGLNLHFDNLQFDQLSDFTAEMIVRNRWSEKEISDIEFKGKGRVNLADFDWSKAVVRSLQAQVFFFQKPIVLTADIDNFRKPYFNVRTEIPSFESKDLSLFNLEKYKFLLPKSVITAKGFLDSGYKRIKFNQIALAADDVKIDGSGQLDFTPEVYTADFKASSKFFEIEKKEKYYSPIGKYKATGQLAVSGRVLREKGKYSLPLFNVQSKALTGSFYGFKSQNISGEFQAKNDFSDLYVATTEGKAIVDKTTFDDLNLSATWRKGNLYASIDSSKLNDVPFKMSLSINNLKSAKRKIRTSMYWQKLDPMAFIDTIWDFVNVISPLVKAKPSPKVEGDLAWLHNFRDNLPSFMPNFAGNFVADTFESTVLSGKHFNAEFDLTGIKSGAKNLSGILEARLQGGVIHQMEKLAEEQQALNITFQPFIIMHRMERAGSFKVGKVLKDVAFEDMAASVVFTKGNMQINNAYTVGPTISAAVSGWVDWVSENFDIIIGTMFSNTSRSGALAENLTDESGNPALAFRAYSAMTKPKVEMQRAKKTGATIKQAQTKGLQTDFSVGKNFVQGDFHAKK